MRIYGKEVEFSEQMAQRPVSSMTWGAQGPPMGFHPFAYFGYPGMMPGPMPFPGNARFHRRGQRSAEPKIPDCTSADMETLSKPASSTVPPFAKKWFDLDQSKRKEIRALKDKWVSAQKEIGNHNAEKDIDGMQTVLPKFAAKWFVLSDEERRQYFLTNRKRNCSAHIPPFAVKWFELPESKRTELRKLHMHMKAAMKPNLSDEDQSEPEAQPKEDGLPKFATKWFDIPQRKRAAIRMRYCHGKKSGKHSCDALPEMMAMMQLQNGCVPMENMLNSQPMMMMMPPHGSQAPMPWMASGPFYNGRPMSAGDPHPRRWARFIRRQQSDNRSKPETKPKTSDEDLQKIPPFVRKWFALPDETRKQLRMMKQYQMKQDKPAADGIPPFAKKWFELREQRRQQWRTFHKEQRELEQMRQLNTEGENPRVNQTEEQAVTSESDDVTKQTDAVIPEFAQNWFALPHQQKHHFRMMNKYRSAKKQDGSGSSADENDETMPDFAIKWFASTPEEQQHLRQMKRAAMFKQCKGKRKANIGHGKLRMHPWQKWALYQQMQHMRRSQSVYV